MTPADKSKRAAWLAENVMGWHVNETEQLWIDAEGNVTGFHLPDAGCPAAFKLWDPLDRIAQAHMLLDKLSNEWCYGLASGRYLLQAGHWIQGVLCTLIHRTRKTPLGRTLSAGKAAAEGRPAEAICLAVRAAAEAGK